VEEGEEVESAAVEAGGDTVVLQAVEATLDAVLQTMDKA
jgi:hypothetical protein